GGERVADRSLRLRWKYPLRWVCEARIASWRRRNARRLIRRLVGRQRVAVGRELARDKHRRPRERGGRRLRLPLEPAPFVQLRNQVGRRIRIAWRARADQPEMVDIRIAKRS